MRRNESDDLRLVVVVGWLHSQLPSDKLLHADIDSTICRPIRDLFNDGGPDIAVCGNNNNVTTRELTVSQETNLHCSKLYKQCKYQNIRNNLSTLVALSMCQIIQLNCLHWGSLAK